MRKLLSKDTLSVVAMVLALLGFTLINGSSPDEEVQVSTHVEQTN